MLVVYASLFNPGLSSQVGSLCQRDHGDFVSQSKYLAGGIGRGYLVNIANLNEKSHKLLVQESVGMCCQYGRATATRACVSSSHRQCS